MTHVEIEERIAAPAEAVWDCFLGSRSEEMAIGVYAESVKTEGEGEGSIRTSQLLGNAGEIRERIDHFDASEFLCRYSVIDRGPLPFADYRGQIRITPDGAHACILNLQADFTPVDMPEQVAIDMYMANNRGGIAKMKDLLRID